MTDRTDRLNAIYEDHKDSFQGGFHNTLWQIMVNERFNKPSCFAVMPRHGEDVLAVITENQEGYVPTTAILEKEVVGKEHDLLKDLNERVFGVDLNRSDEIETSSLRRHFQLKSFKGE